MKIAVIGLGYVGLPLALALARKFPGTVGFDINSEKVASLKSGVDVNDEGLDNDLRNSSLLITADRSDLVGCDFFIVGVPTPIDEHRNPDLGPLESACEVVGAVMAKGAIVVFESTVYPGLTEEICGPLLAKYSGLVEHSDFKLGYSPERINPGDKIHSLEKIVKVVAGEDGDTLNKVAEVYGRIVDAGIHRAPSIKVAEAAKVIENTQRDLNIALMNELSIIFDRMNIATKDVLDAAGTKWNFLRFTPGLVGGHCIGVDPYYLTTKAEQLGYHPQVILAGRRINDGMGAYVAQRLVKLMVNSEIQIKSARVGILGVTFKENVSDLRNSRVPDIVHEFEQFGVLPLVHDPKIEKDAAFHEYGIEMYELGELRDLDALVLAVPHEAFLNLPLSDLIVRIKPGGIFADLKSAIRRETLPDSIRYWSL